MPAGAKPGERRGGRKKGTPNKLTQNAIQRLEDLGCDPLELSAKVALGQELQGPHPALKAFRTLNAALAKAIDKGDDLSEFPAQLEALIEDSLTSGYVPIELRSKHIVDLMQYILPKRKAVEVTGKDDGPLDVSLDATQLDSDTLRALVDALAQNQDASSSSKA